MLIIPKKGVTKYDLIMVNFKVHSAHITPQENIVIKLFHN